VAHLTVTNTGFSLTNLIADVGGTEALSSDPVLVDPWGLVLAEGLPALVVSRQSNMSVSYDGAGTPQPTPSRLVVHLPSGDGGESFGVTGVVANSSNDFVVSAGGRSGAARILYAGVSGKIAGWSPAVDATEAVVAYTDDGAAVYRGLAVSIADNGAESYLYATDFHNAKVDVFDATFSRQAPSPERFGFIDPALPPGYAPFGICVIGAKVYVTYAKQLEPSRRDPVSGDGLGLVDVFSLGGDFITRLITTGSELNAPWAVLQAPELNGDPRGGTLLVGNAGNGWINAFDPSSGALVGPVTEPTGEVLVVPSLHGLAFGNGRAKQPQSTLFFTAGAHNGANGWYGRIDFGAPPDINASPTPDEPRAAQTGMTRAQVSALSKVELCAVRHGDDDERQKADQLNAKEGKPHCDERIGLHMGHMDQRLTDAGNQDSDAQVVHGGASDTHGGNHQHDGAEYR
jgi:uncharacterized protein (TIGR03118 family)